MRFPAASLELDISRQMRYAELAENEPHDGTEDEPAETVEDAAVALLLRWLGLLGGHDEDGLRGDVRVVVFGHIVPSCRV